MSSEELPPQTKKKVIIIGGGMAGLSAANLLVKNDVKDFLILESRSRLGGRIVSLEAEGAKLELGANWIHGVLGNPIYEVAMSNGLVDIIQSPKPHRVVAATEEGKQVPFPLLQEVFEAYMCFLHRCEEYFLYQYLPPNDIESVGEHIELEVAMYLNGFRSQEEKTVRRLIFDCLLKRETCISGCTSMSEVDLLELGSYEELQGGNITLPLGYSSILGPFTRDIPAENILTDQRVTSILWNKKGSSPGVETQPGDESDDSSDSDKTVTGLESSVADQCVEIICENGAIFLADHVICTLPLGVLKESSSSIFSPPLPEWKLEALDRLLFGTVDKIFLIYERPFLNPDISEVMLLWNLEPTLQEDLSESWYKKIYSFSKVSETILLGWVSGKEAEYMEGLTDDVVSEKCTEILRKFLNDPYVPKPKLCIRTHWYGEPNSRGSYTSIGVGGSQCDIEAIAQPLYSDFAQKKPVLLFAGEHTHSSFYSTVHGAYLTGRSCAQTLLKSWTPQEQTLVVECSGTTDLSSWIQGISLSNDP